MTRVPLPREVRPALGPLTEAVPLLFRIETIEIALLLVAASIGASVAFDAAVPRGLPVWALPNGILLDPMPLAREFKIALLRSAAILLLVPVVAGDRGLQLGLLSRHFGALSMATAIQVGVAATAVPFLLQLSSRGQGTLELVLRSVANGILPLGATAWAAWFLGNAVRRRERRPTAREWLVVHPGLLSALMFGTVALPLHRYATLDYRGLASPRTSLWLAGVLTLGWVLLHLFAALWMLRVVENEAEADPHP